ncbi:MAG: hypothetical protein KGR18_05360 [Acidobacteria bacterium]|nr:hypothetical protein [Acidobacteriota bacterium]
MSELVAGIPATDAARRRPRHRRRRPRWQKITLAVVIGILLIPTFSFVRALIRPANLSTTEKAAEWMRDNHLGGVLNTVEAWWFKRNEPKAGGEPDRAIEITTQETTPAGTKVAPHLPKPADVPVPEGVTPVANEGVWQPLGPLVGGAQAMYATQVRPDSVRTSILDGLAWMDPKLVKFQLYPGTEEPGGRWDQPSQVPMDQRLQLLAAFNSGFRMDDARGGFYLDGKTQRPLRDGAASFVIFRDGTASVGMWGRDFTMNDTIVAVRQNLDLILDNGGGPPNPGGTPAANAAPGVPAPGLNDNADGAWGATFGNKILTWRSAVCITGTGAIVYGYGNGLGALSLSQLMLRAGCVRAMQLDINTVWTTFNSYSATQYLDPGSVKGTKLLPESFKSADRYLSTDARDFFAVYARDLPQ